MTSPEAEKQSQNCVWSSFEQCFFCQGVWIWVDIRQGRLILDIHGILTRKPGIYLQVKEVLNWTRLFCHNQDDFIGYYHTCMTDTKNWQV
jgi:hypothetical protein